MRVEMDDVMGWVIW